MRILRFLIRALIFGLMVRFSWEIVVFVYRLIIGVLL